MQTLYNIFIRLMIFGFKVGAMFSYKIKRGLAGRRQSCEIVASKFSKNDRVIWMHAASLGEYEQGMPVLEQLKEKFPSHKILITFFSPSGYEVVRKKNHIADAVCYLPFDLNKWIKEFTDNFRTDIFFTVKYDYWYNLLKEVKRQGAKTYVVSALFYEKQVFFKSFGAWFVEGLKTNIDWFFHQTKNSYALAKTIRLEKSSIAGDTRFDRVKQIKERLRPVEFIDDFKGDKKIIIFGSSWEAEEKIAQIVSRKNKDVKIILAPHDLKRVEHLKHIFPKAIFYSELIESLSHEVTKSETDKIIEKNHVIPRVDSTVSPNKNFTTASHYEFANSQILVIDSIGLLSQLYFYADLAVVGGGFHSAGLHNILEAAAFGVPVFFGNHYRKNPEADALISANGGKSFVDEHYASDFILKILKDETLLKQMGENAGNFIYSEPNSTEIIIKRITSS